MSTLKRFVLLGVCAGILFAATAPPAPAQACPLICRYVNGHWVCGCG